MNSKKCLAGLVAVDGYAGLVHGMIDDCPVGIAALGGVTGRIGGVVTNATMAGVAVAGSPGITIANKAFGFSPLSIYKTTGVALLIADSKKVVASIEVNPNVGLRDMGRIVLNSSEVEFKQSIVHHAAAPAAVTASGSTVSGQRILGNAGGGVVARSGATVNLTKCQIHGSIFPIRADGPVDGKGAPDFFQFGVRGDGGSKLNLTDCGIGSWGRACIRLQDKGTEAIVKNCIISSNRESNQKGLFGGPFDGALVDDGARLIFDSGSYSILGGNAMRVAGGGKIEVRNVVSPAATGAKDGHWLHVQQGGEALVEGNNVSAWFANGIVVDKGGTAKIQNNKINNSFHAHGVFVATGGQAEIKNNRFPWIERVLPGIGTFYPMVVQEGAIVEQANNRAGARDELVAPVKQ